MGGPDYRIPRERMVERQLAARDIDDERVLEAMRTVPRESFVPTSYQSSAYDDSPLPIGHGQTISQPYIVALMIQALKPRPQDRVLEIGGGSGYAAAVLGRVVDRVYTVERIDALCERARAVVAELGYDNVEMICGDGTLGWPAAAPYDGIVVAAGGPDVPRSLKAQLAPGGRLVIPIGRDPGWQTLVRVTRRGEDEFATEDIADVRFVPLIGEEGWR
ncbi:MAG TPA: protein-L-isoaspartate(D-aspartate) O-methyltransferase [Xanthomonadaceae bacterium]|nr:protein-L-isoaspartate(D-aspartate) O-methyltransferase [Xanthomonadaceae bacterium]